MHHWRLPSNWTRAAAATGLGCALLASLTTPLVARADCSLAGTTVTCSGNDPDGFVGGDGLDVEVEALATVSNPGGNVLDLEDDGSVIVRGAGSVDATQAGASAISAGSGGNLGSITIEAGAMVTSTGAGGSAIAVGDDWNDLGGSGITNSGTVSVSGDASTAISVGGDSLVLNETGALIELNSADSVAISAGSDATLENRGMIVATGPGATGIRATTVASVTNRGTINLIGDNATGVGVGSLSRVATNLGTIELMGDDAIGIDVGDLAIFVRNEDTITIEGDRGTGIRIRDDNNGGTFGIGNLADLTIEGAEGIGFQAGDRNLLFNSGALMIVDMPGGTGTGVRLGSENSFTNFNFGLIHVDGASGIGILLDGADNVVTNRSGATIDAATAIRSTTGNQAITNDGSIIGDIILGSGDDALTNTRNIVGNILLGDGDDTLTNTRDIAGNILLGGGDDTLQIETLATFSGTVDAGAHTAGDLVVLGTAATGTFELDSVTNFEALEILEGRWTLLDTGTFPNGTIVRSDARLIVDGSSTDPGGATTLTGDLVLEDGSKLRVRIDPAGDQGHLIVGGDVITSGSVELLVTQTAPIHTTGSFELISANSIGSFQLPTLADTAFLDFEILQTATDLDLVVTRASSYAAAGISSNQQRIGANLDAILAAGPTGDLATLLTEIDQLSAGAARTAFDSLHPEAYDAHASNTLALGFALADLVTRNRVRCDHEYRFELFGRDHSQPSPCGANGRKVWVDALLGSASRDHVSEQIDYDTTLGALVLGVDWNLDDWLLSGFVGSSVSSIDVKGVGNGDGYSIELGGLARRRFGAVQVETLALYGHGWHEQERAILVGAPRSNARGEFTSHRFLSHSEIAYVAPIAGAEVSPILQLDYAYLNEGGFHEKGAGGAALSVDERKTSYLRSGIGARVAYEGLKYYWLSRWLAWTDGIWRGEVQGRWLRTWTGDQRDVKASFSQAPAGTGSFRSAGQDVEQAAVFGGRISFQPLFYETIISVGYDFQFGDGTKAHLATAQVNVPF